MKNIIILISLSLIQLVIIIKSIMSEYINSFTILCYYIIILITAYIFVKILKKWFLTIITMGIYSIIIFIFLFSPKEAEYWSIVERSEKQFLELPFKTITEIKIVARTQGLKNYYKYTVYNKDIIRDILLSLKKCEVLDEIGTHVWDYYAITFIDDKNTMYSIELLKNCKIPNNLRSPLCNRVYIKLNPNIDVFNTVEPDLDAVSYYRCDGIVPLLNQNIETLIQKYPANLERIIN
ncbi:MAG: hypothetical protein CVV49_05310 [Spirochaetae bacterium HGW-Spirochaetae-5]|nr:MAG: hypothetical protein CVV49_05310 [Spirochaetae bacterium HGW-Spirochaetae-5]